jgi:hypothetical protein
MGSTTRPTDAALLSPYWITPDVTIYLTTPTGGVHWSTYPTIQQRTVLYPYCTVFLLRGERRESRQAFEWFHEYWRWGAPLSSVFLEFHGTILLSCRNLASITEFSSWKEEREDWNSWCSPWKTKEVSHYLGWTRESMQDAQKQHWYGTNQPALAHLCWNGGSKISHQQREGMVRLGAVRKYVAQELDINFKSHRWAVQHNKRAVVHTRVYVLWVPESVKWLLKGIAVVCNHGLKEHRSTRLTITCWW